MTDEEVMRKMWALQDKLPGGLDPEIYLTIGFGVGTIARLQGEVARLRTALELYTNKSGSRVARMALESKHD